MIEEQPLKKNLTLVVGITLIVIVLAILFFLVTKFSQNSNDAQSQNLISEPSIKVTQDTTNETFEPTNVPTKNNIQKTTEQKQYSHKKIQSLPFSGFSFTYPANWTLTVNDQTNEMLFLNLKNPNGAIFKITQAPMGGGGCLYPSDPDLEGPYSHYGEYVLVNQLGAVEWRRAEYLGDIPEMQKMFNVCEKQSENFVSLTKIGAIEYLFPVFDQAALIEMDEIVRSIKIDPV